MEKDQQTQFEDYATTAGGALGRAVKEGYDVRGGVIDHVYERLTSLLRGRGLSLASGLIIVGSQADKSLTLEERDSPSDDAFDVLDAVILSIETVKKSLDGGPALPDCLTIGGERILRLVQGSGPRRHKTTVVLMSFESPVTVDRYLLVDAERENA